MKHVGQCLALGALMMSMGGCSSIHLYNKDADTAATSVKADYDASKISTAIDGERAMLDGLEGKEVEAYHKVVEAQRNAELLSLLEESSDGGVVPRLRRVADARLSELVGPGGDAHSLLSKLNDAQLKLNAAQVSERHARTSLDDFESKFAGLPACNADVAALNTSSSVDAAVALTNDTSFHVNPQLAGSMVKMVVALGQACDDLIAKQKIAADAESALERGGEIGEAIVQAKGQEATLARKTRQASDAGKAMAAAAAQLADAQQAAANADAIRDLTCASTASGTLAEKARNALCDALAKLNGMGDFGAKILSQDRLTRINSVLAALSGVDPGKDDPKLPSSLALLGAGVRFSHALQEYRAAGTLPALEPLLIDKQLTSAQLARAQSGVELAQTRVRLAREIKDAKLQEADLLDRLQGTLGMMFCKSPGTFKCTREVNIDTASMTVLLNDKSYNGKQSPGLEPPGRRVYRAMALLSESYSVARDRQAAAQVRLIDVDYRESLVRSQASVAAWDALISVPVDQLKAYHAGGWTAQEIAQMLQAFGVVGVAARIK